MNLAVEEAQMPAWIDYKKIEEDLYAPVNDALRDSGLISQRVKQTPGWEAAVEAIRPICGPLGPIGPANGDTWWLFLEITSHENVNGHGEMHRDHLLELVRRVIEVISVHRQRAVPPAPRQK